jgi:hypothetical protein
MYVENLKNDLRELKAYDKHKRYERMGICWKRGQGP